MKIDTILKHYFDSGERKRIGFGKFVVMNYEVGDWPELENQPDIVKAINVVSQHLTDNSGRLPLRKVD